MVELTPEQQALAEEHAKMYYRLEDLRRRVNESPTPELLQDLTRSDAAYDEMSRRVARLAQTEADKRTAKREAKFRDLQSQIETLPPGPHRNALQTFLDDARIKTWEDDDWQTAIRNLMAGDDT